MYFSSRWMNPYPQSGNFSPKWPKFYVPPTILGESFFNPTIFCENGLYFTHIYCFLGILAQLFPWCHAHSDVFSLKRPMHPTIYIIIQETTIPTETIFALNSRKVPTIDTETLIFFKTTHAFYTFKNKGALKCLLITYLASHAECLNMLSALNLQCLQHDWPATRWRWSGW